MKITYKVQFFSIALCQHVIVSKAPVVWKERRKANRCQQDTCKLKVNMVIKVSDNIFMGESPCLPSQRNAACPRIEISCSFTAFSVPEDVIQD